MLASRLTASMLYDCVHCPHRVWLDLYGDSSARDPVSPFVELLWERGNAVEREIIEATDQPFVNLKKEPASERERLTRDAMSGKELLIYGGRISTDELLGEPDLLRLEGNGYVAGDIKSGAATESGNEDDDRKPKKHYAVQLALYQDILCRKGLLSSSDPFVWDVRGDEVAYDLSSPRGPRTALTMWEEYEKTRDLVMRISSQEVTTTGAWSGMCKQCHWRSLCKTQLLEIDDLTLVPELGRDRRDKLENTFRTVAELAAADLDQYLRGAKTSIDGIGADMLRRFHARARLQKDPNPKPFFLETVDLPPGDVELFFDVETDPMRGTCYLHGFVERTADDPGSEKYVAFLAERPTADAEEASFADAWDYMTSLNATAIFYYSPYERTTLRQLAERYPHVATREEVDALFASSVTFDLYQDLVRSKMIWPSHSLSIKDIAAFLGFKWRDAEPSGAASIQWYHKWVETSDDAIRMRILEYNEDDCTAMRVLADAVRRIQSGG